jgi:hypothetical protein
MAVEVARQRLAQFRDALLPGVEGFAGEQGLGSRTGDKIGCCQISLADPERDQAVAAPRVLEYRDDAARRRVASLRAQPKCVEGGRGRDHLRFPVGLSLACRVRGP